MRLVPFFLSATLAAQTSGKLPWDAAPPPPWNAGDCAAAPAAPAPLPLEDPSPLRVTLTQDGALRILDSRGAILLRTGLPGRPAHLWRDGGVPVADSTAPLFFPRASPLARGLGALPVVSPDFRPALAGLLWIISDDGRILTLIHAATARVCYLPLPGGRDLRLAFHPDRLEARETPQPGDQAPACWSLPWLALLPQLIQLGQENTGNQPTGTALNPYPKG